MDNRLLLTVVLCLGILFVWTKFFMPPPPAPQPGPAQLPAPGSTATAPSPTTPPPQPPGAVPGAATSAAEKPAEVTSVLEEPGRYRARFTSWGAAPTEWELLNPQYQRENRAQHALGPIDLVRDGHPLPLSVTLAKADVGFDLPPDAAWTPVPGTPPGELAYTWENERLKIEKRFRSVPGTYQLQITITVENKSDQPLTHHLQLLMSGWQDPNLKPGGMFSRRVAQTEGQCDVGGKLKKGSLDHLLKQPVDEVGAVRWVGVGEQYFVMAAAIQPSQTGEGRQCTISASPDGRIVSMLRVEARQLAPKQQTSYTLAGFFGPKKLGELDAVKVGGVDAGLGSAVDYGWTEAIARPMLAVLKAIHRVVPNWGVAIILLTLLLKALTWWPTTKSMRSMKEMAKLKPEMDKLKEKFGNDKQRMNAEVMELYKKHGINPLGGCLPMLIQMPIYIALYSMLGNSVELYRSAFVFWIHDLTAPDAYFVLPLATGALMFAQQKLSPTPPDQQQKAMMYMMPVMFTAFSIFLPSGLTLYILTNTLLTMVQQGWMNRHDLAAAPRPAKA
jgi:YidC/Oxa1 family membrane protein insertase